MGGLVFAVHRRFAATPIPAFPSVQCVPTDAAAHEVWASAAIENVRSSLTDNPVGPRTALHDVIAAACTDQVVAVERGDVVVAAKSRDHIRSGRPRQLVIAAGPDDRCRFPSARNDR